MERNAFDIVLGEESEGVLHAVVAEDQIEAAGAGTLVLTPEVSTLDEIATTGLPGATVETAATSGEIDYAHLLRDRPDVFQAFFTEYYGGGNDHHSSAWIDRVGGVTPDDYARYWFKAYGEAEGYVPTYLPAPPPAAAVEGPQGRTTANGVSLDEILRDRPDVFQAFFTEYYGVHNDRHSNAWVDRVGGETVQDYANYWYETYGKASGYVPSSSVKAPDPASGGDPPTPTDPVPTPTDPAPTDPGATEPVPTEPGPGIDAPTGVDEGGPLTLPPGVQLPGPDGWPDVDRILAVDADGNIITLVGHSLSDGALF